MAYVVGEVLTLCVFLGKWTTPVPSRGCYEQRQKGALGCPDDSGMNNHNAVAGWPMTAVQQFIYFLRTMPLSLYMYMYVHIVHTNTNSYACWSCYNIIRNSKIIIFINSISDCYLLMLYKLC